MKKTDLKVIFLSFFCLVNLAWGEIDLKEIKKLAESGDVEAQFNLGLMYEQGQGVPQNYSEAVKWYRKAAEQGHADAQYFLGTMYVQGQGVKNLQAAYVWWSIASANGHKTSKKNLQTLSSEMTPQQIAQAQKEADELRKRINKSKK